MLPLVRPADTAPTLAWRPRFVAKVNSSAGAREIVRLLARIAEEAPGLLDLVAQKGLKRTLEILRALQPGTFVGDLLIVGEPGESDEARLAAGQRLLTHGLPRGAVFHVDRWYADNSKLQRAFDAFVGVDQGQGWASLALPELLLAAVELPNDLAVEDMLPELRRRLRRALLHELLGDPVHRRSTDVDQAENQEWLDSAVPNDVSTACPPEDPLDAVIAEERARESSRLLAHVLSRAAPRERQLVETLLKTDECSLAEAGRRLGIAPETARVLWHRTRRRAPKAPEFVNASLGLLHKPSESP